MEHETDAAGPRYGSDLPTSARTQQEKIHQDTESNTEHLGVEKLREVEKEVEDDPSSIEEHAEDLKFADDEDDDGEDGGEEGGGKEHEDVQHGQ